jgi:ankyrin repeat protein
MASKRLSPLILAAVAASLPLLAGPAGAAEGPVTFVPEQLLPAANGTVDPNARLPDGSTPLQWAAYRGDVEEVQRLIRAGADVAAANNYGATAMSIAAETGNAEVIRLLLAAGADPESPNAEGQTALMAVARTGNIEAARALLKARANVNAVEQWGGQSALMWAAARHQPEMVRFLLKNGADPNMRSRVTNWPRKVTSEPREKKMDRGGFSALAFAAREGCTACAKALVEGGADINLPDGLGTTPLILAIMNGQFDTAKYLIEAGADVQLWDFYGMTPLYAAVDMNGTAGQMETPPGVHTTSTEIIRMLLERGANVNAQLKLPLPSRIAAAGGRADKRAHNIGATPLLRAAVGADLVAMKLLIEHGALLELPMADGTTPMLAALLPSPNRAPDKTEKDALAAMRLLKEAGADPKNAVARNTKVLHLIHTHGMNEARVSGSTALMMAAVQGWKDVIRQLAEWGVDMDARDADGLTALDYAMGRARVGFLQQRPDPLHDIAALLRELGATVENPDLPPWKPLMVPRITAMVPSE